MGFILLLTPNLSAPLRTSGGQLLVVSLPFLSVAIGLLGASSSHTARIDALQARFLRQTVGNKLEAYLVAGRPDGRPNPYPAIFARMESEFRAEITSFCFFHFFDDRGRRFDVLVKSNVFNFEIVYFLRFARRPAGLAVAALKTSYDNSSLDEWSTISEHPLVALATGTMYGSLSEGYTVNVDAVEDVNGFQVAYRLRQKMQSNFLTTPYLRRYFAEDAAIGSYYFYAEALGSDEVEITSGEH